MKTSHTVRIMLAVAGLGGVCPASAQGSSPVAIETVTVGNPGNAGESISGSIPFGGVAETYRIGKYEVTAGQYAEFLNAVAATDVYGLYHVWMDYEAHPTREGCNIKRSGTAGSYTYSVAPDWADRPVNFVSWADAVRFVNWLHNGQPTGGQDLTTTEDGSYFIDGIGEFNDDDLEDVFREPDASWVLPTEDEWYKAAYHKNDGVTGNYWNYPTSADNGVSNQLIDPDPGNSATFTASQVPTVGPPYFRTEFGAHENSPSPYGAFDLGGNVQEFNETVVEPDIRGIRGGSWQAGGYTMSVWVREDVMHSSDQFNDLGFRVALVADVEVINLRGFGSGATYFEWDPMLGGAGIVYDIVRGDLASLSGDASGVDLGLVTCIENDLAGESSEAFPDHESPSAGGVYFYLVRFQEGATSGPWGFGSAGGERIAAGGCAP